MESFSTTRESLFARSIICFGRRCSWILRARASKNFKIFKVQSLGIAFSWSGLVAGLGEKATPSGLDKDTYGNVCSGQTFSPENRSKKPPRSKTGTMDLTHIARYG